MSVRIFLLVSMMVVAQQVVSGKIIKPFGYGNVEHKLVTSSSRGRTGQWWCNSHFAAHYGGFWKCLSVSGANSCSSTVPNDELVSCSEIDDLRSVNVGTRSAVGRTGQWWCDNHFGANLGGTWECLSVTSGKCSDVSANNAAVTCGLIPDVDESPFEPSLNCNSPTLNLSEKHFCAPGVGYMNRRTKDSVYLYNDYVRVGFNRSFGGTIFELYGTDKINRIEEHGGSALQLSLWGYGVGPSGRGRKYFTTTHCSTVPYDSQEQCMLYNNNIKCESAPNVYGDQISDCMTEIPCEGFSAAAPWNPMQALGKSCMWNTTTNDIDSIYQKNSHSISFHKSNPYNYTKSSSFNGLEWDVTGTLPDKVPYVELIYNIQNKEMSASKHNQEIPAIFLDQVVPRGADVTNVWKYYYYNGSNGYSNSNGTVSTARYEGQSSLALLPSRDYTVSEKPGGSVRAKLTEDWMSTCNNRGECVTVAAFSPWITGFSMNKHYISAIGNFSLQPGLISNIKLFIFPYNYSDVVEGKTIREWVYTLKHNYRN